MKILDYIKSLFFFTVLLFLTGSFSDDVNKKNGLFESFENEFSEYFRYGSGGNRAEFTRVFGAASVIEPDTRVLSLKMDPDDNASPWQGPNISSHSYYHYGTYAGRIKIPEVAQVQPDVGGVVGFFTYHNDPEINGHSEIDYEWLIADPEIIYMNAWLDTDAPPEISRRRVGRIVNLAKGIVYTTTYTENIGDKTVRTELSGNENMPETIPAIENFNAAEQFHIYGFDWEAERIRWWIIHPETSDTIVLWDYQGPRERITQTPARFMLNIWHTNDWPVHTNNNSIERPVKPFGAEFDWVSYTPLTN